MQLSSLPLKVYIKNITRSGKENIMTGYLYNEEFKTVLIGNGFSGSEVFIGTNDTIEINIKSFPKGQKFLIDSIHNYMFLNFRFLNRNKIVHQFFDSLAYIAGIVNVDNVTFKDAYYNIDTFFKIATLQYLKRLNYLTNYNKNHQLGEPYTHYAFMEIKSAYLFNLLTVFMNPVKYVKKGQLSQQYIDSILSFKLDDEDAFYNTFWYKPAVFTYVSTVLNEMDYRNYYSDIQLKNRFETIRKNFAGKMRDYLLTSLLSEFYKKQNKNYDSLIIVYHSLCSNKIYINSIDSLIDVESKRRVLSENEALNNRVNNFYGKSFLFKNIINSKPLVIDCWASWCIPCIEQMAITKKFEVKYSGKIDFIFLSFDKEKIKWISKVKQLNLYKNNCYLLKGNFRSVFAQYFDIGSIPRYIIIDKEGKVVTANSIRPSHKVEFDELLKDLID
ncbi:MAG: TlpA disulfide reductase family protein [Ginsengibacter sp.]